MNAAHLELLFNHPPMIGFAIGLLLLGVVTVFRGDRGIFLASVLLLLLSGGGGLAAHFSGEPAEKVVGHQQGFPDWIRFAATMAAITTLIAVVVTAVIYAARAWAGWIKGNVRHSEVRMTNSANSASQEREVN